VNGESYTAVFGDIVIYNSSEFIFDGTTWSAFGGTMDNQPTQDSAKAVTSDGVYRYTAGQKEYSNNTLKGEIFNTYSGNAKNVASGDSSHAEGSGTKARAAYTHAEGLQTTATGLHSHAEGFNTFADGTDSHSEGYLTRANKPFSHAEGNQTVADGWYSHAGGLYTIANTDASTAIGQYNVADGTGENDPKHLFIIGNGTGTNARSNILEVSDSYLNVNGDIKKNGVSISPLVYDAQTESFVFGGVSNG
jgi:hypothetical protein